jgi:hypothetical protein
MDTPSTEGRNATPSSSSFSDVAASPQPSRPASPASIAVDAPSAVLESAISLETLADWQGRMVRALRPLVPDRTSADYWDAIAAYVGDDPVRAAAVDELTAYLVALVTAAGDEFGDFSFLATPHFDASAFDRLDLIVRQFRVRFFFFSFSFSLLRLFTLHRRLLTKVSFRTQPFTPLSPLPARSPTALHS